MEKIFKITEVSAGPEKVANRIAESLENSGFAVIHEIDYSPKDFIAVLERKMVKSK